MTESETIVLFNNTVVRVSIIKHTSRSYPETILLENFIRVYDSGSTWEGKEAQNIEYVTFKSHKNYLKLF